MARYRSSGLCSALPRRTLEYLQRGASEGTRNAELFDAACQLRDAGRPPQQSEEQLLSRAMADGLSEGEARQTIQSAYARSAREPVRGAPKQAGLNGLTGGGAVTLPTPVENGFVALLSACFEPNEYVAIAPAA